MISSRSIRIVLATGAAVAVAIPLLAQQRSASGPIARYDMRAGTVSGVGAMGGGGAGMMGMMMGGGRGNNLQHELLLRLGSSRTPDKGAPKADHFMPPVAKLGKSVALITPREEREATDQLPGDRPRGRILIYWGCAAHAPKGQPVVIDLAKIAAGQMPPGLWSTTILRDIGPTLANSKTYGRWPAEDGKYAKPESSLIGAHRIAGNYSPEIAFNLTKDFMGPLRAANAEQPGGASLLSWGAVMDATGYYAMLIGGKQGPGGQMGDMVMWSSSASRQFGGGLSDWLTPGQVAPLVRDRTVMAPTTTSCMVPAEVRRDAPDFRFGTLIAYGPLEDFSYPPRPADARIPWNLEWTARIRHRSMTSWMDMPGMPSMDDAMRQEQGQQQQQAPVIRPECAIRPRGGLGGMLGNVLRPPGC
jgi:hypothetical protein